MKAGEPGVPSMQQWLEQNMSAGEEVGVDPFTISTASALSLKSALEAKNVKLTATPVNLVDQVWADRPAIPASPIRVSCCNQCTRASFDSKSSLMFGCDVL